MNLKIPAWYPWFWHDWKSSPRVMALSPLAKHAYRSLLDSQWENAGKLPNQPKIFFKYADCSPSEWDSVAADVLQFFPATKDEKFIANPKLAQEWESTSSRMRLYSVGGKRSAESKKRKKLASTFQAPCSPLATPAQHLDHDLDINKELLPDAGASEGTAAPSKKKPPKTSVDPRFTPTHKAIFTECQKRFSADATWDAPEAAQLKRWLKANPKIEQEKINQMVANVYASERNPGRPCKWLPDLTGWIDGPKDKFNSTKTTSRTNGNAQVNGSGKSLLERSMAAKGMMA